MGTLIASAIILSARQAIQDLQAVRWTDTALLEYLNEAQLEISRYKPDSCIKNETFSTTSGIVQQLPSDAIRLIDVVCNVGGSAITQVDRKGLALQNPGWPKETASSSIKAFMYHDADPTRFYVYPPAASGASLAVVYSARPAVVAAADPISLTDEYKSSLIHYICFKCFSEDSMSPDANKASMYHQLFINSLQMSDAADKTVEPVSSFKAPLYGGSK